jgi:hypothetical protein
MYDYVIIGGGICGLTLSWILSKNNKKIALIDKNNSLGGCHRVYRISEFNNLFSEHGPRIYIDNYLMFKEILNEMNLNFYDLFVPYKFNLVNINGNIIEHLTLYELYILFIHLVTIKESYRNITMLEFLNQHKFSSNSIDYIDRLCRLTDGASIDRYTLYCFLQIMNQNSLHQIYQPKLPNDIGLFRYWEDKLLKNGVKIYKNSEIKSIEQDNFSNKIKSIIITNNIKLEGQKFIFAIPPYNIIQILNSNSNIKNAFGKYNDFYQWMIKTNYLKYIPIVFHWNKKLNLPKIWGFPKTSWGLAFIVLSDYMNFNNENSKTVISTIITKNDKSDYINKTPNDISNKDEIIKEAFRQLKISFPNLPEPTYMIMSQNNYINNQWEPKDTAFIETKYGFITNKSIIFDNLFNCGVYNGNSKYSFTSVESTICNAIKLIQDIEPTIGNQYLIKSDLTVLQILQIVILVSCIFYLWKFVL